MIYNKENSITFIGLWVVFDVLNSSNKAKKCYLKWFFRNVAVVRFDDYVVNVYGKVSDYG